jgi:hypothetical protein
MRGAEGVGSPAGAGADNPPTRRRSGVMAASLYVEGIELNRNFNDNQHVSLHDM